MNDNNLNVYLRNKVWNKFAPLVKKDICEICGSIEGLQVHHVYPFIQMVDDTLVELGLERKPINEYTDLELKNIEEKVMGKHLLYEYKTLCIHCHISGVHKKHKITVQEFIIPHEYLDKYLHKQNIVQLIKEYNFRDDNGVLITANKFLNQISNKYKVIKKRVGKDKKTMYKITKL